MKRRYLMNNQQYLLEAAVILTVKTYTMKMIGENMKLKYLQVLQTMLTSPDFLEDSECRHILNVAPDRLLSIFRDKYCEEMVFLTV